MMLVQVIAFVFNKNISAESALISLLIPIAISAFTRILRLRLALIARFVMLRFILTSVWGTGIAFAYVATYKKGMVVI